MPPTDVRRLSAAKISMRRTFVKIGLRHVELFEQLFGVMEKHGPVPLLVYCVVLFLVFHAVLLLVYSANYLIYLTKYESNSLPFFCEGAWVFTVQMIEISGNVLQKSHLKSIKSFEWQFLMDLDRFPGLTK